MGILEGILYTLWRGIAIGIIISAPMGPVGILCVQRTLDKGRRTGLYTGIGAAISDLIYCLLTGFGLSFIEEFLDRNSNIIQLIGSIVLIGFGIYLFKSNPSRKLKKPAEQRIPAGKNILNGFLFTFSNPLIIFLIIGLFARFNFQLPEIKFYHYIIGYMAIFGGALGWWYFVTYFVDKVRAHFNLRSMWLVNKIIGGVIFLFAIVGIIGAISGLASAARPAIYMNSTRGYQLFRNATDSTLIIKGNGGEAEIDMIPVTPGRSFLWDFRAATSGKRESDWSIWLKGKERVLEIRFLTNDNHLDETYTSPHLEMIIEESGKEIIRKKIYDGLNIYNRDNSFRVIGGESGLALYGGNRAYMRLHEVTGYEFYPDSIGFSMNSKGMLNIDHFLLETNAPYVYPGMEKAADFDDFLNKIKKSEDSIEGEWAIFDRSLEDDYLRMGGDYRLALVRNGNDYDIIYISGAVKNPGLWNPGMYKGKLKASAFDGVYDVEWIDSSGRSVNAIKAQYENDLIKVIFTELSSELRLGKITNEEPK